MRTLAEYKGAVEDLRIAVKQAKSKETRREWIRAIVHAQRRVSEIERRVLTK